MRRFRRSPETNAAPEGFAPGAAAVVSTFGVVTKGEEAVEPPPPTVDQNVLITHMLTLPSPEPDPWTCWNAPGVTGNVDSVGKTNGVSDAV